MPSRFPRTRCLGVVVVLAEAHWEFAQSSLSNVILGNFHEMRVFDEAANQNFALDTIFVPNERTICDERTSGHRESNLESVGPLFGSDCPPDNVGRSKLYT